MNRIKELRKKYNYSQEDLAEKFDVDRVTISRWENGINDPSNDALKVLASLFNVSVDYLLCQNKNVESKKGVKIPVLGRVVAGIPIEAITDILDWEEIPAEMAAAGEYFALKVKGDSMSPNICEDDIVIVKRQNDIECGEIAIVLVNGEDATVKKVNRHENGITLVGYNPTVYAPHFYTKEEVASLPISIVGKVVELRRTL
jgi:repressor LexA